MVPRREAWVAGGFGLVHGLALASSLPDRDLGRAQAAWTLLGVNLGVGLAPLGLLAIAAPWLPSLVALASGAIVARALERDVRRPRTAGASTG